MRRGLKRFRRPARRNGSMPRRHKWFWCRGGACRFHQYERGAGTPTLSVVEMPHVICEVAMADYFII